MESCGRDAGARPALAFWAPLAYLDPPDKERPVRISPVVLAVVVLISSISGCSSRSEETLARAHRTGVLRVGTDATYPPFETIDTQGKEVVGFDADLMRAVGQSLGLRVEFVVVPFDGILAALRSGKYDAVISALTITEDRAREILFSRPYHAAGQSVCVTSSSPIHGPGDLGGRRLGVQLGTTGEREAHAIAGAEVISFDAIGAAFLDLASGRCDAVIADTPTAALYVREHPDIRLVGEPINRESYGIAFRQGDVELKAQVDAILEKMEEDGTLRGLRQRWGLEAP
jgi:polar amino acid transport system substrate-binding protein